MNTNALNTAAISAVSRLPWITAAANLTLRIVGAATVSLRKYGAATQSMTLSPHLQILRRVYDAMSLTLSLTGELPARAWVKVYGAASQFVVLTGIGAAYRKVVTAASTTLAMFYSAPPRSLTAVHATAAQTLTMTATGVGTDFYTGPAPDERVTGVVDLTPKATATISIGA